MIRKLALTDGKIGFIGLGRMGTPMAINLASDGREVVAYIRRPDRMRELAERGLKPTTDSTDLFDCDVVVTMLPDDDAVLDASFGRAGFGCEGFAVGLKHGAIHLSMGTIGTATASLLAREHARNRQGYVSAPVFGHPDAARARQLFIVMAGAPADVERCRALVGTLGRQTFIAGTDPGRANLVTLLGNMMMARTLDALGASIATAGLSRRPAADVNQGHFVEQRGLS
jgi:3-hydroxyisobutyrate dehydrogenase-like beta-hydroxyacid dehydrogenase